MSQHEERPADKVYTAANGHRMEVSPQQSKHDGTWYFVYAYADHSDSCWCYSSEESSYNVSEYAGEEE